MSKQRKYLLRQGTLLMVHCVLLLSMVMAVKGYALNIYRVAETDMEPLLRKNDRVLVNKLSFANDISKGDLVVFKTQGASIGIVESVPGDTVSTDSTAFVLPKECSCRHCPCSHDNFYLLNTGHEQSRLVRKADIVGCAYNLRFWE